MIPPGMLPDGKPMDDAEPKDMARLFGEVFEKVADMVARGGPTEEERASLEEELRRASALIKVWVNFGRWLTTDDLRGVARHALWLAAPESARLQNLVNYANADRAVRDWKRKDSSV